MLPADQVIEPVDEFARMLTRGADLAGDGETLVTFGIAPGYPATGYGYVELGAPRDAEQPRAFDALGFREKPDRATAEQFVAAGRFWWNSGIVVFAVRAMRAQMARHCPELAAATDAMLAAALAIDVVSGRLREFAARLMVAFIVALKVAAIRLRLRRASG